MTTKSSIEWTELTWNPVTGCTKVSQGCKNCYAERMANRLKGIGISQYRNGFQVTLAPQVLANPYGWRKPRRVFVNSMSDLFHERVPEAYIQRVFHVMIETPQHTYQILTKRSDRLAELSARLEWPDNVWMGVSVEDQGTTYRISSLIQCGAKRKFLSVEPLIGPIRQLPLRGIEWVIVGGESGPRARPMKKAWVQSIHIACQKNGVAFFFKQWGGIRPKAGGRELDGRTWDELPARHPASALVSG